MSTRGAQLLHLVCQGGDPPPCPLSVTPLTMAACYFQCLYLHCAVRDVRSTPTKFLWNEFLHYFV